MKVRALAPAALLATTLFGLTACSLPGLDYGQAPAQGTTKAAAPKGAVPEAASPKAASPKAVDGADRVTSTLAVADSLTLGPVVTDDKGFTLYRFEKDPIDPPASHCSDQCASTWPPVQPSDDLQASGIDHSLIGTITRTDGTRQVTIAGHPVYRYNQDKAPGDVKGQGVGQTWFAATATGGAATEQPSGATLSTANSSALGTIVTDADGFTLYRFDHDGGQPPTTTCFGDCAKTWPPAVVTSDTVTLTGVDQSVVGTILRPDGTRQLTIGGWPVYEYSKDTAQGDVRGQGVGGTWYAVTPTGAKNTGEATTSTYSSTYSAGY